MVHMDRTLALHYTTTMRDDHYAVLPTNGPALPRPFTPDADDSTDRG